MEIKVRYESFDQFFRLNKDNFQKVQKARTSLKSPQELGMTGSLLVEAESLAYQFLNLKNLVSDLLFGVGASVLDSKHNIKNQSALAYRELTGPQGERKMMVEAESIVVNANKKYNDLNDLKEYLENKYNDCENNHYYYKQISQGKTS